MRIDIMKKINVSDLPVDTWTSPKGTFEGSGVQVSIGLGRDPRSTDAMKRHPFDLEILTVPPGKRAYPYHAHSAQWELYYVVSGAGVMRHAEGETPLGPGDAMLFEPGQAHQLRNDGSEPLVLHVIADNPFGEACYYPDSGKWLVQVPERRLLRSEPLDYFDGEE